MKILCEYTDAGPSYVRTGWGRVFKALGHTFSFWRPEKSSAFDAFSETEPDLFIGTTYGVDRAVYKNIVRRPNMKVALFASAWGELVKDLDIRKYPVVVASDREKATIEQLKKETGRPDFVFIHVTDKFLEGTMGGWRSIGVEPVGILNAADTFDYLGGKFRPELACDVAFVGGYWPYKARNIDNLLLPLCHPSSGLNVKIFGNRQWPVHQYLGFIENHDVRDLFASAKVCVNISEPHSTDLGWDIVERPFKVLSSGGFCVSDHVEEIAYLFNGTIPFANSRESMANMVRYFVDYSEERLPFMERGRKLVLEGHTYWDRVAQMFDHLGMRDEAERAFATKAEVTKSN